MVERTKRQMVDEIRECRRMERRYMREQRLASRACFWSWPWGHLWETVGRFEVRCRYCGKETLIIP
jgi:hypothetical protein